MFAQMLNNVTEQSKSFIEPTLEFNRIAFSQAQKLGAKQLELVNEYAKLGLGQLEKASKIQSLDDVKNAGEEQLKTAGDISQKLINDANEMVALGQEMSEEWKSFIESKLQVAEVKAPKAAKKVS